MRTLRVHPKVMREIAVRAVESPHDMVQWLKARFGLEPRDHDPEVRLEVDPSMSIFSAVVLDPECPQGKIYMIPVEPE